MLGWRGSFVVDVLLLLSKNHEFACHQIHPRIAGDPVAALRTRTRVARVAQ